MIYRFQKMDSSVRLKSNPIATGRFIVQRHQDNLGVHIDIRLEHEGYLTGWRIDGVSELADEMWGEAKLPHNPNLLYDANLPEIERGIYQWYLEDGEIGILELVSTSEDCKVFRVEKCCGVPLSVQRKLIEICSGYGLKWDEVSSLIGDGLKAREWMITKICGMAQYLDDQAFVQDDYVEYLKNRSFEELKESLIIWEKRLSLKKPVERVTKPINVEQEINSSSNYLLNKVLELVGGRDS